MEIFKVFSAAVVTLFLCLLMKRYSPEYALACGILGSIVILRFASDGIGQMFESLYTLANRCGIKTEYITIIIKISGIAFIGQFCASLCRDSGESALAANVELCTSVLVIALGMPIVMSLFSVIAEVAGIAK